MLALISTDPEEIRYFMSRSVGDRTSEKSDGTVLTYCRIADFPVVLVSVNRAAGTAIVVTPQADVEDIVFSTRAKSLVPYLQAGDFVIANRILPFTGHPGNMDGKVGGLEKDNQKLKVDMIMADRLAEAYSLAFDGRSDRPELVVGGIISGEIGAAAGIEAARLYREFGVVAADREAAEAAGQCQDNGFVSICTIVDDLEVGSDPLQQRRKIPYADLFTILVRYLESRNGREKGSKQTRACGSAAIPIHVAIPEP
jgi:hypothetical protein